MHAKPVLQQRDPATFDSPTAQTVELLGDAVTGFLGKSRFQCAPHSSQVGFGMLGQLAILTNRGSRE
jgi:hypothetical protein